MLEFLAHPTWNKEEKVDAKQPKLESYFPKKFSMDVFEKLLIEYIILRVSHFFPPLKFY